MSPLLLLPYSFLDFFVCVIFLRVQGIDANLDKSISDVMSAIKYSASILSDSVVIHSYYDEVKQSNSQQLTALQELTRVRLQQEQAMEELKQQQRAQTQAITNNVKKRNSSSRLSGYGSNPNSPPAPGPLGSPPRPSALVVIPGPTGSPPRPSALSLAMGLGSTGSPSGSPSGSPGRPSASLFQPTSSPTYASAISTSSANNSDEQGVMSPTIEQLSKKSKGGQANASIDKISERLSSMNVTDGTQMKDK